MTGEIQEIQGIQEIPLDSPEVMQYIAEEIKADRAGRNRGR